MVMAISKVVCMNKRNLRPFVGKLLTTLSVGAAFHAALIIPVRGQAPGFSLTPMRMDVEIKPGTEKTVSFEVKAGPSATAEQGRLEVIPTDWGIQEDGSITFAKPASEKRSASPWIAFSPAALTIQSGRSQLVRITVTVPEGTAPGTYWSGLFVQERGAATPPEGEVRAIFVRVRYAFILNVIVSPASAQPELVNVEVDTSGPHPSLTCEMTNTGNRHVRPVIFWTIRRNSVVEAQGKRQNTVLLPFATIREPHTLDEVTLTPGSYEVSVNVDFQDGKPQQSMTRTFEVAPPEPPVPITKGDPDREPPS